VDRTSTRLARPPAVSITQPAKGNKARANSTIRMTPARAHHRHVTRAQDSRHTGTFGALVIALAISFQHLLCHAILDKVIRVA
jgi:hypothetical protein